VTVDFQLDALESTALESVDNNGLLSSGEFSRLYRAVAFNDEIAYQRESFSLSLYPSFRYQMSKIDAITSTYEDISNNSAWNMGTKVRIGNMITVNANIGTSFRVPSFDDLFWSASAFAVGNPYLEDETANTFDISLNVELSPLWSISVAYFSQDIDNLIVWSPSPTGQWSPDNIGKASKKGFDISSDLKSISLFNKNLSLNLTYSYLDCVDVSGDNATYLKSIPYIPKHTLTSFLSLDLSSRLKTTASVSYMGYRYLTAENTKIIPSYTKIDLSASYQLTPHWKILASVDNLLDQQYYDIQFYPVPGISGRLSVRYSQKGVSL